jgi:hypothetical protein
MGSLRSAFDELTSHELRYASDDDLIDDLDELERASGVLEVERSRRIAELERRATFGLSGHRSMASWLTARFRLAWSVASRRVHRARALEAMPLVRAALIEGEISLTAADELVAAREADLERFVEVEAAFVDVARELPLFDLRRATQPWRAFADRVGFEREHEHRFERRRLHLSPLMDGMVRIDGDLDPETGQTVITALRAVQDTDVRAGRDDRTAPQRRADALGELCRRWLDRADRPTVGGERPHVTVVVDVETLEGRAGRRSDLEEAGRIPAEAARRIACDASIARVITDGRSMPLDVGRRTPVVSAPLRRAVVVRDEHCTFPGCDRPPGWCDAHHVRHWADGGATSLDNLALLCRAHHRLIHARRFTVEMREGRARFAAADGTVLGGGPAP